MIPVGFLMSVQRVLFLMLLCLSRSLTAAAFASRTLLHRQAAVLTVASYTSSSSSSSYWSYRDKGSTIRQSSSSSGNMDNVSPKKKGKLLVLGGTGFLGENVCKKALLEGYQVTSLSRRGLPPPSSSSSSTTMPDNKKIDYRKGDARQKESIANILQEGGYVGVIHCVGLLFDDASGLGSYNRFVSGSGSLPDADSTYETITRVTAFNAIEAAEDYVQQSRQSGNSVGAPLPFCFTSAAEAGWPDVPGGEFIEQRLVPDFLRRYLKAKRAVEARLLGGPSSSSSSSTKLLRPIIVRPSLIYSLDRPASYVPVGAFFIGNKIGLPFVDRPVTVQALAAAMIRAIGRDSVKGVLRFKDIDELNA
jgi:nucleoside-diphosphate-sugar epimerase